MITIRGKIRLDDTGLRVNLDEDFSRYYIYLITKAYHNTIKLDRPRHGTHLSIVTQKLHKDRFNKDYLRQYHNQVVDLQYNPEDIRIGGRGFTNFWFPMDFPLGLKIKNDLGIVEDNFLGFHCTICNNKSAVGYKSK